MISVYNSCFPNLNVIDLELIVPYTSPSPTSPTTSSISSGIMRGIYCNIKKSKNNICIFVNSGEYCNTRKDNLISEVITRRIEHAQSSEDLHPTMLQTLLATR